MSQLIRITVLGALLALFATSAIADAADPQTTPPVIPAIESDQPTAYRLEWSSPTDWKITEIDPAAARSNLTATVDGSSVCNVLMNTPFKSGAKIYADGSAACTPDVNFVNGTDYLFRGLGPTYVIGQQYKQANTNYVAWQPSGDCAASTWAYFHEVPSLQACSSINGCSLAGPFTSNYHYYSC